MTYLLGGMIIVLVLVLIIAGMEAYQILRGDIT